MDRVLESSMAAPVESAPKRSRLRMVAVVLMVAAGIGILSFAMTSENAANRDFISYWAAGRQLVHHCNPYDGAAILRLERAAGFEQDQPFFMRNPPVAFFMALPLGWLGARPGVIVWSLGIIAALMVSVRLLWTLHGRPPDRLHLVGYCFPPVLACLLHGQIGVFLLLGVVLFLTFHESSPYVAGSALLLCALKPHLFLPFGVGLLVWVVSRKAYPVLVGAGGSLLATLSLAWFLDPAGWSHYAQMVRSAKIENEFIPTVSLLLRLALDRRAVWIQFLPAIVGCAWALGYSWKNREAWNWTRHGSLLLLVSMLVAPYSWFTDEAMVLPAILAGLYFASDAGRSLLPFGAIAGVALLEVFANVWPISGLYVWTAPAWLVWYLYATRGMGQGAAAESGRALRSEGLAACGEGFR